MASSTPLHRATCRRSQAALSSLCARSLPIRPSARRGTDIKAAWVAFARAGIPFAGVAYDSMLASFVLDPGSRSHALNDLAREHLSVELPTTAQLLGKGKGGGTERTFAQVPPRTQARVSAAQAEMVLRLEADSSAPGHRSTPLARLLDEIEIPLVPVLVDYGKPPDSSSTRVLLGEMSRGFTKELLEPQNHFGCAAETRAASAGGTWANVRSVPPPFPFPSNCAVVGS